MCARRWCSVLVLTAVTLAAAPAPARADGGPAPALSRPTPLAARPTVDIRLPEGALYVNQPATIRVVVSNFTQDARRPVMPDIDDLDIRAGGVSNASRTMDLGGQVTMTRERSFSYVIVPRRAGELTIPPIEVTADGQQMRTSPTTLTVYEPDRGEAGELLIVDVTTPRDQAYVGQRIPLTLRIAIRSGTVSGHRLTANNLFACINGRMTALGPFPTPERYSTEQRATPDGGRATYYVYQTTTDYVPQQAGDLSLDNVLIVVDYPTQLRRDVFGELAIADAQRVAARPELPQVEVRPLPEDGKPAGFTGAVGTFNIDVSASPLDVRVGDPITLDITIRGDGPIETLPPPDLAAVPGLSDGFRIADAPPGGRVEGSTKHFSAVIRPTRPDVQAIPPLTYPYFDPDRGEYAVARSNPIPLEVEQSTTLSPAEIEGLAPVDPNIRPSAAPADALRGEETRERVLLRSHTPISLAAVAAVTLGPAALFVLVWAYVGLWLPRAADVGQRRRRTARRTALRRLSAAAKHSGATAAGEAAAALRGFVADRLNLPPGRVGGGALLDELRQRGVPQATIERCAAVLNEAEQLAYGGARAEAVEHLIHEAHACLVRLGRAL